MNNTKHLQKGKGTVCAQPSQTKNTKSIQQCFKDAAYIAFIAAAIDIGVAQMFRGSFNLAEACVFGGIAFIGAYIWGDTKPKPTERPAPKIVQPFSARPK